MNKHHDSKSRALSLLRTLGSTVVRAGQEAIQRKLDKLTGGEEPGEEGRPGADLLATSAAALRLAQGLDELKGAAMKVGQMLSLSEDLLPKGWQQALSRLQAQATAKPWQEMEPILQHALPNFNNVFESIEPVAVHAASIGQVHKGTLRQNQKQVAVKIRYPHLETFVRSDLENMKSMLRMAKVLPARESYEDIFKTVEELILQELDFAAERSYYELYFKLLNGHENFVVPQVIVEACSDAVLTTEWITGQSMNAWIDAHKNDFSAATESTRTKLGSHLLELLFLEMFEFGYIQSDPNPGNFLVTPEGRLAVLDFGATQQLTQTLVDQYRTLTRACCAGSTPEVIAAGLAMGALLDSDTPETRDVFVRMMDLVSEPFMQNTYCWRDTRLALRVKEISVQFALRVKFRAPPANSVFLNRRLLGTQLMLERLGATVPARSILARHAGF